MPRMRLRSCLLAASALGALLVPIACGGRPAAAPATAQPVTTAGAASPAPSASSKSAGDDVSFAEQIAQALKLQQQGEAPAEGAPPPAGDDADAYYARAFQLNQIGCDAGTASACNSLGY